MRKLAERWRCSVSSCAPANFERNSQAALEALSEAPATTETDEVTDAKELVIEAALDETEEARDDVAEPTPPPMIPPFEAVPVCEAVPEDALDEAELSSNKKVGVNAYRINMSGQHGSGRAKKLEYSLQNQHQEHNSAFQRFLRSPTSTGYLP